MGWCLRCAWCLGWLCEFTALECLGLMGFVFGFPSFWFAYVHGYGYAEGIRGW